MTKRNRRTWDISLYDLSEGFDSDVQNFTLTYSEALEATVEGVLLKIAINGFMCGFPICCVIAYLKRWYKFSKTGNPEDVRSPGFGVTECGQIYALCQQCLNSRDVPSFLVGID